MGGGKYGEAKTVEGDHAGSSAMGSAAGAHGGAPTCDGADADADADGGGGGSAGGAACVTAGSGCADGEGAASRGGRRAAPCAWRSSRQYGACTRLLSSMARLAAGSTLEEAALLITHTPPSQHHAHVTHAAPRELARCATRARTLRHESSHEWISAQRRCWCAHGEIWMALIELMHKVPVE